MHKPDLAIFDFRLVDGDYASRIKPLLKDKMGMGILYASGDELTKVLTKADGEAYIQKPYGMEDLLQSLVTVHEIKTKGKISDIHFPNNFRLLRDFVDGHRTAA